MYLARQKFLDRTVGTALCHVLGGFEKARPRGAGREPTGREEVRSILFIKLVALGDAVLLLPVIRLLRERFPAARITLLTTDRARPILERSPHADEILLAGLGGGAGGMGLFRLVKEIRRRHVELAIDAEQYYRVTALLAYLSGAPRRVGFEIPGQGRAGLFTIGVPYHTDRHEFLSFLDLAAAIGVDLPSRPELMPLPVSPEEKRRAREILTAAGWRDGDLLVGLHPGSGPNALSRRWPAAGFAAVGDWAAERHGARILITGNHEEVELARGIAELMRHRPIVAVGRTTLGEFAALLGSCPVVVSNDSGPMHLAAAMGCRVVGLFGPNIPEKWRPWGAESMVVQERMTCSPCTRLDLDRVSDCQDNQCMKLLSPRKVIAAVDELLSRARSGEGKPRS